MHLAHLEGLAAVGKLRSFQVKECAGSARVKIIAVDDEGNMYETMCLDARGAKRLIRVLEEYLSLSKLLVSQK